MAGRFNELPSTTYDQIMAANLAWPSFQAEHPDAINTTVGVLIDPETTHPWQPSTVTAARIETLEETISSHNYSYQTQAGHKYFLEEAGRMVLGGGMYSGWQGDLLSYQALGGTGALSLVRETLSGLLEKGKKGKIPLVLDQGWPNHPAIFSDPFSVTSYDHKDPQTGEYNHQGSLDAIESVPDNPVLLLQTCGYNDDGADRTKRQWGEIIDVATDKKATVIMDSAYLGLAEGTSRDRYPIQLSVDRGLLTLICFSASKNMGLYNERLGALFIANAKQHLGEEQYQNLNQFISKILRRTISNTPLSAAKAAAVALSNPDYHSELEEARKRLETNRETFSTYVEDRLPGVRKGKGLFTKLLPEGFTPSQMAILASQGIHALPNSRLNLGGMHLDQIGRVGDVMASVIELTQE